MDGSIVGKIITVQYFEETKNQDGGISLRFPTVKVVHGDQREL
jgi:DNA ligase-1